MASTWKTTGPYVLQPGQVVAIHPEGVFLQCVCVKDGIPEVIVFTHPDREKVDVKASVKTTLTNRRLEWKMGRTISMGPGTYEFTRLDVGESGDISDGVDVKEGFAALASDVIKQLAVAETAVRGGKDPLPMPREESLYEEDEDGSE